MKRLQFLPMACAFLLCIQGHLALRAEEELVLLPSRIGLATRESRQTIVVQQKAEGQFRLQALQGLLLESSDESVVRIEEGEAVPVGNGTAKITATVDGQ